MRPPQALLSLKQARPPYLPRQSRPQPRAHVRWPDAFGIELRSSSGTYGAHTPGRGRSPRGPPREGSLRIGQNVCVYLCVCVCSPLGEGRGRAWPRPLAPAASAPHRARGALRSMESGPGGGGGLSTALALSQWAGVLPGSWPRPRTPAAPGPPQGGQHRGPLEGLCGSRPLRKRVQRMQLGES